MIENALGRLLFASRWLLLPFYVGLVIALAMLVFKFIQKLTTQLLDLVAVDLETTIVVSLKLVDITLVGNLLLMVILAGYENFIGPISISSPAERPDWMGKVSFADLKMKLIASLVAISAIQLLEAFLDIDSTDKVGLAWMVGVHLTFVVSGLLLALTDRLGKAGDH